MGLLQKSKLRSLLRPSFRSCEAINAWYIVYLPVVLDIVVVAGIPVRQHLDYAHARARSSILEVSQDGRRGYDACV